MADTKAAAAEGAAAPAKKSKLKLIIIVAVAVLLLGGGAAAYFLTRPKPDAAAAAAAADGKGGDEKKADEKKGKAEKPAFVDFEMFTVNLKDPEKFLQIKLTFQVKTEAIAENLKELMPLIRSAVIPVLSSQDAAEIMTSEGKEKMLKQVVEAANQSIAGTDAKDAIDSALITHMIIQ